MYNDFRDFSALKTCEFLLLEDENCTNMNPATAPRLSVNLKGNIFPY